MELDVNTLFMVTMHVEVMLGLLLYFVWAQNFSKKALAWWGSAHMLRAGSIMLFGMHGSVPGWASIDVANAGLFASFALLWCGARVFGGRSPEPVWALVGVTIWLLACRLPQFSTTLELRSMVGSGIVTAYVWLTAFEFWRNREEPLISRWPSIFLLFAHGSLFLLRTPLGVMLHMSPASQYSKSGWLGLLSVEALLFTISISFILVAMAKEHTELRHRNAARTDELTGIANRRGFLEQAVASMRRANNALSVTVLLFDLDRFKPINDQFGHGIGDRVLQIFADTAKAHINPGLVGRWGGDEFVAVLYDTPSDRAATLAERIQVAFEKATADIDGRPAHATVSTGMVYSTAGALDLPSLLVQADSALYRAKEKGRNRLEVTACEAAAAVSEGEQQAARARLMRRQEVAA